MKPNLFVGSSTEALPIAYSIQNNLDDVALVVPWTQGIFDLTRATLDSLLKAAAEHEFGVFVFSPADIAKIRDTTTPVVRDNVLLEFGIFIGRLGRERTYFVLPNSTLSLRQWV